MVEKLYHIKFPYLNISLTVNPVAFHFGNIKIHWYGIILAIAFISAFLYVINRLTEFKIKKDDFIDVILCGFGFSIIGARGYYVLFYPGDFYKRHPMEIFNIFQGGIAIYGGIIVGLGMGIIMCKMKNVDVYSALDITSLGLLIGQSIGRWGNFVNQEAFGSETDIFCAMLSENTFGKLVHPCFLYESIWCAMGFVMLHIYSKKYKRVSGNIFFIYLIWYAIGRFFIEILRTDSLIISASGVKVSQAVSIILIVMSTIFLFRLKK